MLTIKSFFDKTFWKFILVGVANTLFGTAIMFVFHNVFHLGYWISSASNYVFGSILSYFLNKYFTFESRRQRSLLKFAVNITLCYAIAYGAARPLARLALSGVTPHVQDNIAMLIGMGAFVLLNYCGQRFFVFRGTREKSE